MTLVVKPKVAVPVGLTVFKIGYREMSGCSDRRTVAKDGSVDVAYPMMPRVRSSPLALRVLFGIAYPPSVWRTKCKMITPRKSEVVAGLRQAAQQLIVLMDRTTDPLAKHLLATQTFELLLVASQLAQNDESRAAELLDPSMLPRKAGV
jgi:hypothetical protein